MKVSSSTLALGLSCDDVDLGRREDFNSHVVAFPPDSSNSGNHMGATHPHLCHASLSEAPHGCHVHGCDVHHCTIVASWVPLITTSQRIGATWVPTFAINLAWVPPFRGVVVLSSLELCRIHFGATTNVEPLLPCDKRSVGLNRPVSRCFDLVAATHRSELVQ